MSEISIWTALRNAGLSENGTAGVMGNLYCESLLKSDNVEDRCSLNDSDYTGNVDRGLISKASFIHDTYGYGLAQWTYYTRKDELFTMAKNRGVSISDEGVQCDLLITELKRDYSSLYKFLCTTNSYFDAADKFCEQFERPAVNNYGPRRGAAAEYYRKYAGTAVGKPPVEDVPADDGFCADCCIGFPTDAVSCDIECPVLREGDMGRAVYMAQCGLNDMGYSCGKTDGVFGPNTKAGVNKFKYEHGLNTNGEVDADVWQILFQ